MSNTSNNIIDTIQNRHSTRAFLDKDVPKSILEDIILTARQAASSKNTQPWHLTITSKETKSKLSKILCQKFDDGIFESPDYTYSPNPLPVHHQERARECGRAIFELKGIPRDDKPARHTHTKENLEFFGAPIFMALHTENSAERGTFLDLGQFLQNIMLGLIAHDLASCPQASITMYTQTIKETLGIPKDHILVCGLSIGYSDPDAKVNTFIPDRLPLDEFCTWV